MPSSTRSRRDALQPPPDAVPVYALCRWLLRAAGARDPRAGGASSLASSDGRRSSRPRAASCRPTRASRARTASRPQLALRVGDPRRARARRLRRPLLPALGAPGAVRRRTTCARRRTTSCGRSGSRRRAGRSSTATGRPLVDERAGDGRAHLAADLPRHAVGTASLRRLARVLDVPLRRRSRGLPRAAAGRPAHAGHDQRASTSRGRATSSSASASSPGVDVHETYLRDYPRGRLARPSARPRRRDLARAAEGADGATGRRPHRPGRGRGGVRPLPPRPGRPRRSCASTRSGRPRGRLAAGGRRSRATPLRLTLDLQLQQAAERAIEHGIELAQASDASAAGPRTAARSSRSTRATARSARSPRTRRTSRASTSGASTRRSSRPLLDQADREEGELPRAQPRDRRPLSAGLDVQAGDRARGDAGAPDLARTTPARRARGLAGRSTGSDVQELEPGRQPADDADRPPSRRRATPTSTSSATSSTSCRRPRHRSRTGPRVRVRQADRDRRRRRGSAACCRRRSGGSETFTRRRDPGRWEVDQLWKPGDSIQLAIGQKDLLVTPLQLARFYAMIANGGKLVTPHVAVDVEQPGTNAAAPSMLQRFAPSRRSPVDVDPAALAAVRDGPLPRDARRVRHRHRRLRQLPGPHRRQDGHGREGRHAAGWTTAWSTSRGGAATGRSTRRRSSSSAP